MKRAAEELSREELITWNYQLQQELAELKRMVFGQKRERFIPSRPDEQTRLAFPNSPQEEQEKKQDTTKETVSYQRKKPAKSSAPKGRQPLPAHLPRQEEVLEPGEDTTGMKKIGEEVTEELEYDPGRLYVKKLVRPKYGRHLEEEGVAIAPMPKRTFPKSMMGPGIISKIIHDKYLVHLPIYRQIQSYQREGVELAASTIDGALGRASKLLTSLYEALRKEVLGVDYLMADETPTPVLDEKKPGSTHKGYHWVYYAPEKQIVLFDYRPGRGRDGPKECLKNFTGYLQSDGYPAYDKFGKREGITLLNCMAHARRQFEKALNSDPERARHAMNKFQQLYDIERHAREQNMNEEQRKSLREEKALPVLEELEAWMRETSTQVTPQSALGKAIAYSLKRWKELKGYTREGRLEIDNNLVENQIRPSALGRKNYLFAGSHNGARRSAMFYSLLGTCKQQDINPLVWLKDVLIRLPVYSQENLWELLPQYWKPAN